MNPPNSSANPTPLYVIGFPKSGNTWLARLLAEVTGSNISVSNEMDIINAVDNSAERRGRFVVCKIHYVNDPQKVFEGKGVYIVRDVRDALVSGFFFNNRWCTHDLVKENRFVRMYFNYELLKLSMKWQGNSWTEFKNSIKRVVNFVRPNSYELGEVGSWSDHVAYWTKMRNIHTVRYEDMLNDTKSELRRILDFLRIDASDGEIASAISNQSFDKKKANFLQKGDLQNAKFMRSGRSGGWKYFISQWVLKSIENRHANVMDQFGYKQESHLK